MNFHSNRRAWMVQLTALGIGSVAFQRALAHKASLTGAITPQMINDAQWIADVELTDSEKETLAKQIQEQTENERKLRALNIDADTGPAMAFVPYFFAEHLPQDLGFHSMPNTPVPYASKIDSSWLARAKQFANNKTDHWDDELAIAGAGIVEQAAAIRAGRLRVNV